MIIYLLIKGFTAILYVVISIIPTFETPSWVTSQLPDILFRIASFNWYLPVYEAVGIVLGLITFTLSYKLIKVALGVVQIDLNK